MSDEYTRGPQDYEILKGALLLKRAAKGAVEDSIADALLGRLDSRLGMVFNRAYGHFTQADHWKALGPEELALITTDLEGRLLEAGSYERSIEELKEPFDVIKRIYEGRDPFEEDVE